MSAEMRVKLTDFGTAKILEGGGCGRRKLHFG
jgi:hypothetical protein